MAKFIFAPQRSWTGEWYTPEPTEYDDTPAKAKPAPAEDNTPFRFAPGSTRKAASFDPFGSSESSGSTTAAFKFAPGLLRKATSPADESGFGVIVKSHDEHGDGDCDCHGSCSSCSAEYMKFVKSARPAQKLEVGSRVRCKSCPGQPGKKVMVVRELTATEKGYLLSLDYEDASGSMHGIFDHDELVAA